MTCPNCGEQFSFMKALLAKLTPCLLTPCFVGVWLERLRQAKALKLLKRLYAPTSDLTDREHFVCSRRIGGQSTQDIAAEMNVTRERIIQIEAKALRKLLRQLED